MMVILQKLFPKTLKNFAWKWKSRRHSYFSPRENNSFQGEERKQRVKEWCAKFNGEEPFSFRVGWKSSSANSNKDALWVLQALKLAIRNLNQTQLSTTAIWSFNCPWLGILGKIKSKTSLKTETRSIFLVSQLMLLETSRPVFSTAAIFAFVTKG